MTQKFSAQRKRAFLNCLSQSGNQTLSAERAKVSRSWVCLHRQTDPEFDAACREAIDIAKMMLRDDAASPPLKGSGSEPADPRWRYHDGVELVVGGTGGSGGGRRTQIRRANVGSWTPKVEQRFLAVLAGTANVRLASREVGMWPPAAYNHRRKFPGFARAWDQAVEIGMCELESQVHENLNHYFDRELPEPDAPMRDVSVMDAIRLVRLYERRDRERRR
ncbi:MAG TPA: hypothetical protein VFO12_07570 [Sphingomicrobium sp.]|nr:hypothetical protein [Sphingomicrobium sp.]